MKGREKNKNNTTAGVQPLNVRIGPAQRTVLTIGRDLVPRGTIEELTQAGRALAQRAREGGEEREVSARAALVAACAVADEALAYNAAIEMPAVRERRDAVVVNATTIKATLARWAIGDTPVAKAAAAVQQVLFPATENFARLDQGLLWQLMIAKAQLLADDDALKAELGVFVPEAATTALFAANDALGDVLPRNAGARVEPVDLAVVVATLQARTQRYAAAVIAATDLDDAEAVRRTEQALQPLAELRAQRRAQRRRTAKAKAKAVAGAAVKEGPAPAPTEVVVSETTDDDTG